MAAIDVTDATFQAEVLERSMTVPVVIDLWAPWCGPCRTLGPILEKVIDATGGTVALAKVNVDENPRIASTFQVQSIPAVFAIHEGKVVDQFLGALPERAVQEFVDRLAPQPSEADQLVDRGDEASLRRALELEPAHAGAIEALAALLVEDGRAAEALTLLERIPENAETRRIAARARLPRSPDGSGTWSPDEVATRIADLLEKVPGDDEARQQIVDLIETMDLDDPRRSQYRRALTSKL
ncbi:MAG TPA: thioredoxin, partial [Acidimicrobiales bacterium]|nr:thioredoxin [Acidimicrobiales bacterium]